MAKPQTEILRPVTLATGKKLDIGKLSRPVQFEFYEPANSLLVGTADNISLWNMQGNLLSCKETFAHDIIDFDLVEERLLARMTSSPEGREIVVILSIEGDPRFRETYLGEAPDNPAVSVSSDSFLLWDTLHGFSIYDWQGEQIDLINQVGFEAHSFYEVTHAELLFSGLMLIHANSSLYLYDPITDEILNEWAGYPNIKSITVSHDKKKIAIVAGGDSLSLDVISLNPLGSDGDVSPTLTEALLGNFDNDPKVAWSPDSGSIAAAYDDGNIAMVTVPMGGVSYLELNHQRPISQLQYMGDRWLLTLTPDGSLAIWDFIAQIRSNDDLRDPVPVFELSASCNCKSAKASADNKWLAVDCDGELWLWDIEAALQEVMEPSYATYG